MVKVSGQTVGSGTGERVSKSGTGTGREASEQIVSREESGTGTVHLAVGRETREHKSVTGEVGKHRSGKKISQPFPLPYRSRTAPTTFPVPTFTARSPGSNLSRETKFLRANRDREKYFAPAQLTTIRIGNHTR